MNLQKQYLQTIVPGQSLAQKVTPFNKMMKNPLSQFLLLGVILLVVKFLQMAGLVSGPFLTSIGFVLVYSIAAIGFCLLLGYSGLASLGTAGFVGLGAYLAYYGLNQWGVTILPTFLIAGIVAILLGFVIGFISLKIEGIYLAILTLALSEIVVQILKTLKSSVRITNSDITFFGLFLGKNGAFIIIVVALITLLIFTANLINSPTGRAMLAMKNSTSAAQAMGISLLKYRLLAFVISTLYASIAGFMYMLLITAITSTTSTILTLVFSLNILGAVIIGGAKSLWGTMFGVFFIYGFQQIVLIDIPFFQENPGFIMLITGLLLILIVMFYPGGFAQMFLNLKWWFKKKKAQWKVYRYGKEA